MKKLSTISFTIISLAAFIVVGVSFAGERVMVIEMADGHLVTLPMTLEETAAQDTAKVKLERRKSARFMKPKKRVVIFEMGESGQTVSFPMTEKEIATEDAKKVRLEGLRVPNTRKLKPHVVKIELSESGYYILFPMGRDEKDLKKQNRYSQKSR